MQIRPLHLADLTQIKKFTDTTIGENYFSSEELEQCYHKSMLNGVMYSFVLIDDNNKIQGLRLAYPPGMWSKGKGAKLRPELWKVPQEKAGYFQSLFLSADVQGAGWGPKLSDASIVRLKEIGTEAIITHAWQESPNNSSIRYLTKFGFEPVATHPNYWIDVDYTCVRDGKPCRCTAVEMIKYL